VLAALLGLAGTACEPTTEVVPVSYLAVVALFDDSAAAGRLTLRYHIAELSGTVGVDTLIERPARDTLILELPPATYAVGLDGLPSTCTVSRGTEQWVQVYPPPSTALARYFVRCQPALTLLTTTEGSRADSLYVWTLDGPAGRRSGLIGGNDSLRFDSLAPGSYDVVLSHVAPNCVVVSDGGPFRLAAVPPGGGASLRYRVACSDPAHRPQLLSLAASARGASVAFTLRATDPDRDMDRYIFDVTDCAGRSVLPSGSRQRGGLAVGRTANADTVLLVVGFDVGVTDSALAGRCAAVRLADQAGNTTPIHEVPLGVRRGGQPPMATTFAARVSGGVLRTDVQAFDPDGDFAGYFYQLRVRDGVFGSPDGTPDVALFNTAGYLTLPLPELVVGSGLLRAEDILAVVVFLIDARGQFVRLEDTDIYQ
jgi:hypothetical protein